MSDFTFETKFTAPREQFEWDNVWWEQTDNDSTPRVLYIGDSISCAIRRHATSQARGKALFDGFGTSKSLDNPYFKQSLLTFAEQQGERDLIIFNNGLHGGHLDDAAYTELYRDMLLFLRQSFAGTPLAVVLTTYTEQSDWHDKAISRNECVCALAEELGCPIIDLYAPSYEARQWLTKDKVHFEGEGCRALGAKLAEQVIALLADNKED